jgi:hypothetical protein
MNNKEIKGQQMKVELAAKRKKAKEQLSTQKAFKAMQQSWDEPKGKQPAAAPKY